MSYEPLHHKYRPQTFAELVGQEAIATTLSNALRQQRIAPAYLFTGARGTGKTSSARILAKSLNCLASDTPTAQPCGKCEACRMIAKGAALDVIEIDAASNTGVDNIRELIERSQFAPVQCRYKVYVVDECLTGDSLVLTQDGLTRIDDPTLQSKKVLSYNDISGAWEYKPVVRWLDQGERETFIIKTANREIRCTGNHLIRTEQGWIAAKDITAGMKILSPASVDAVHRSTSLTLLTGSLQWATQPKQDFIQEQVAVKHTATSGWERTPPENGYQTYSNTQFPQWRTNLETVESVCLGGVERVYDIEVEDNHNFVANGLLVHNCHMLSTAAFNALLKTLEEPPDRVVFVLATTDPQRVLPTIISRCQRFDFRRIPLEAMVTHLGQIAEKEAIDVTPEAIQLVAQISQGGLRDAEALLDQLSLLEGSITVERVWDLVGAVPERDLFELVQAIAQDDATTVIDRARHLMDRGREPLIVLQNLASFYRDLLIAKASPDRQDLVAITPMTWEALCEFVQGLEIGTILKGQQHLREAEIQVRNTAQPRLWLEVTLMGLLPSAIGSRESGVGSRVAGGQGRSAPAKQPSVPSTPQPPAKVEHRLEETSPEKRLPEKELAEKRPVERIEAPIADVEPLVEEEPEEEPIGEIAAVVSDPTPSATSSAIPSQDLEQIWQEAIDQIRFRGTQVLLQQQGHLLFFDGFEARVGIKSQPLFKMAKEKLSTIETAFEAVYQRKVRVSLEVMSAAEVQATLLESPQPASRPTSTATIPPNPSASRSRSVKESASSSSGNFSREPFPQANQPPPAPPSAPPQVPSCQDDAPELDASTPIPWQADDEVSGAAKSLAQFFNGQIVSLDNDLPVGKIEDSTLELSEPEADEADADDDVPF